MFIYQTPRLPLGIYIDTIEQAITMDEIGLVTPKPGPVNFPSYTAQWGQCNSIVNAIQAVSVTQHLAIWSE